MLRSVAAPAKLIVVALVSRRLNVPVKLVVISPPSTFKSPSRSTVALLMDTVPVEAPISILVAAPNALTVVAFVLSKLNDA